MNIVSESLCTPVRGSYDVIVAGGGIAGVSAAIASARNGKKTLLLEKQCALGGLATTGQVIVFLALCDGKGKRVLGGIAAELMELAVSVGPSSLPKEWVGLPFNADTNVRCESVFNAPAFAYALERILTQAGCDILFDTRVCAVVTAQNEERKTVTHVITEDCSGRGAYSASAFVDATGSAELFNHLNAPCAVCNTNVLTYWSYSSVPSFQPKIGRFLQCTRFPSVQMFYMGDHLGGGAPECSRLFCGTDVKDESEFLLRAHASALERVEEDGLELYSIPGMPQLRTIRHIEAAYTISDVDCGKPFADCIAHVPDWRPKGQGKIYSLPFRALYDERITNLFAAGRIIGSSGDAWEVTRGIPSCAASGEAAGTAAAMLCNAGSEDRIDVDVLQSTLRRQGVII